MQGSFVISLEGRPHIFIADVPFLPFSDFSMDRLLDLRLVEEIQNPHLIKAWNVGVLSCVLFQTV